MVVSCVCEAEEGKKAEEGAEDNGDHGSVSAAGLAEGLFNEAVAIKLRHGEEGAAGDVEASISRDRVIS